MSINSSEPPIYTPVLSKSEEGDGAGFIVEKLQQELINSLKICDFKEHPNVTPELARILTNFTDSQSTSRIETDSKDGLSYLISKPLTEMVHFIVCAGKGIRLDDGDVAKEITNLFIFDKQTGKIADLRDLWMGNPLFQKDVAPMVISGNKASSPGETAQLVKTWRPIIALTYLLGRSGLSYHETHEGAKALAIPHELGHLLQMNEITRRLYASSYAEARKNPMSGLIWLKLASFLPFMNKDAVKVRNEIVKIERNAHAFGISLFRKLNANGIHTAPLLPKMMNYAKLALESYDLALNGVKGNSFVSGKKK